MSTTYSLGRLKGRYVVTWREEGGRRRRYRLRAVTKEDATREAIDVIRRETETPGCYTVKDLWDLYREDKKGRRVADAMRLEWKVIKPSFGHLRPDQITVEHSRAHTALRRANGIGDGTIWTELGHLSTVLKWATEQDYIARRPAIERPPKPEPRDRYLTRPEIAQLLSVDMAHHVRVAVHLMLGTAARSAAALELTWDRVDFDRRQIDLRASADGPRKGRAIVAMNPGLARVLADARRVALSEYVVEWNAKPVKSIKTALNRAVAAAGLEGVPPHVFRHTAAVTLAESGVPMAKIAQILGHSDSRITERVYARFSPEHLQQEMAALDFTGPAEVQPRFNEPASKPYNDR